jgi:hypothetical protein
MLGEEEKKSLKILLEKLFLPFFRNNDESSDPFFPLLMTVNVENSVIKVRKI